MKIKMAATMLLCSFVIFCSEVSAAGSSGQLFQSADCGCGAAPVVEDCGCEAAADEGCGCRQPVRGLLSKLRSGGCGCGGGCQAAAVPAPVVDCGCGAAPSCGCKSGGLKGLLTRMAGQVSGDCGCGPTCEEPAAVVEASCGCAPEPAPVDCGCEEVAASAPKQLLPQWPIVVVPQSQLQRLIAVAKLHQRQHLHQVAVAKKVVC